jgi:hypothetical protein
MEVKVTMFLTRKIANQLFSESFILFNYCAKSSSEIVAEGLFRLSTQIRRFLVSRDQRELLIKSLAVVKDSVLSTRWSIKSAATFAAPDLIDESLPLMSNQLEFLAAIPSESVPENLPPPSHLDELVPFVERDPPRFFELLKSPPSDGRALSAFFACLRLAIPQGFEPPFDVTVLADMTHAEDPTLFALQMECFALMSLRGAFAQSFVFDVFRQAISATNPSIVIALSLCFNRFPSVQLFDLLMRLPLGSPSMMKAVVHFVTEVDFESTLESTRLRAAAVEKLVLISKSSYDVVQSCLVEHLKYFNCGRTYPLFRQLFLVLDLFDPAGFRAGMTILAALARPECREDINALFAALSELDATLIWGDAVSLNVFLDALKKFVDKCPKCALPPFAARLPLLVLRGIVAVLYGQWDEQVPGCPQYNRLLDRVKRSEMLLALVSRQSLTALLEIRDRAAACAAAIHNRLGLYEAATLDLLGKKLIHWPSSKMWGLLGSSAKTVASTTGGLRSPDPDIVLAAATRCPDKFQLSHVHGDTRLLAFAVNRALGGEFDLSVKFVRAIDAIAVQLPQRVVERLTGSWLVICLARHIDHQLVRDFIAVPFDRWEGPPQFWRLLPKFLFRLQVSNGWRPHFHLASCDSVHLVFASRHLRLFAHDPFADYGEIQMACAATTVPVAGLVAADFYDAETLRGMRATLYQKLGCGTFAELMSAGRAVKQARPLFESVGRFLRSEDCYVEAYSDALLLALELFLLGRPQTSFPFEDDLRRCPFRGVLAQIGGRPDHIPADRVCLESEMDRMIPMLQLGVSQFPVQPLSPMAQKLTVRIVARNFGVCSRCNFTLPYGQENEARLTEHLAKFGISPFVLDTIEKWIRENDILPLVNSALTYAAAHGTYYIQRLSRLMRAAMGLHKSVMPVVEAFVLALGNTPLKKALEAEFMTVTDKQRLNRNRINKTV